jgi:hypothetical protein
MIFSNFFKTVLRNNYEIKSDLFVNASSFLDYSKLRHDKDACKKLDEFIDIVKSNSNLKFSQKIQLLDAANAIKVRIGC